MYATILITNDLGIDPFESSLSERYRIAFTMEMDQDQPIETMSVKRREDIHNEFWQTHTELLLSDTVDDNEVALFGKFLINKLLRLSIVKEQVVHLELRKTNIIVTVEI